MFWTVCQHRLLDLPLTAPEHSLRLEPSMPGSIQGKDCACLLVVFAHNSIFIILNQPSSDLIAKFILKQVAEFCLELTVLN
jgi:hypothetical protein